MQGDATRQEPVGNHAPVGSGTALQLFEKELASFGQPQPSPKDLVCMEKITCMDSVVIREEMN